MINKCIETFDKPLVFKIALKDGIRSLITTTDDAWVERIDGSYQIYNYKTMNLVYDNGYLLGTRYNSYCDITVI